MVWNAFSFCVEIYLIIKSLTCFIKRQIHQYYWPWLLISYQFSKIDKLWHSCQITSAKVVAIVAWLDQCKTSGPDGVPCFRNVFPVKLSSVESVSHNLVFLLYGNFPLVPVFNNWGDRSNLHNYRPISLLQIIIKVSTLGIVSVVFVRNYCVKSV